MCLKPLIPRPASRVAIACWLLSSLPALGSPPSRPETQQDDVAALVAAAGRALEAGDLDLAASRFEEAAEIAPQAALPRLGLSDVAARRGDFVEALRFAGHAEQLAPTEPEIVLAVARYQSVLGRDRAALETLARLRALAPDRAAGYRLAASLLSRSGGTDEAIAILDSGFERGVGGPRLAEDLTLALLTAGETEWAISVAENAVERFPEYRALHGTLGLALAAYPERRGEAVQWLESALAAEHPAAGRILLELAALVLEDGETDRALDHLRAAAALLPNSPEVYYRLGAALRTSGDLEAAKAALTRYQELERAEKMAVQADRNLGTRFNEAQSLAGENRLSEALEAVDALLAEHPREDRALALRGKVLFSLGRREEALSAMVEARQRMPGQVEYQFLEGLFLLQLGRAAEAEAPLRRALALDAELADAHALLGMMLSSQERYEEAVEAFEQALELGVDGASLRLGFAEALRGAGREAESEAQLEAYRRLTEG